jgi:hypothetical protein
MGFDVYGRKLKRHNAPFSFSFLRVRSITTLFFSVALTLSSVGIAAPLCTKYVATTRLVQVRNRVSKHTAELWAKWRVSHPNWKPNPSTIRPKYKLTTQEAIEKLDFACSIAPPEIDETMEVTDEEIPTSLLSSWPIDETSALPSMLDTSETLTSPDTPLYPPISPLFPPINPPVSPIYPPTPPITPTPEPSSLYLLGSGLLFLVILKKSRQVAAS